MKRFDWQKTRPSIITLDSKGTIITRKVRYRSYYTADESSVSTGFACGRAIASTLSTKDINDNDTCDEQKIDYLTWMLPEMHGVPAFVYVCMYACIYACTHEYHIQLHHIVHLSFLRRTQAWLNPKQLRQNINIFYSSKVGYKLVIKVV